MNAEEKKAYMDEYREKNREVLKEKAKARYELNREKRDAYTRDYHDKHRDEHNEASNTRKHEHKVKCITYKGGHCVRCTLGYNGENAAVFHFHHVNPDEKDCNIAAMRNWEDTLVELDKCIMLCANCHALVHGGKY